MSSEITKDTMTDTEAEGDTAPAEERTGATTAQFVPSKPKMGGVTKISNLSSMAWTGGKPLSKFTGLEEPSPDTLMATQYRPTSIGAATKGQLNRITGFESKFTRKSDLLTFQKKTLDHLVRHGMDTITYLTDPTDSTKVVSIVSEHAQFTLKEAKNTEKTDQQSQYDEYDKANIRDAKTFFLNSLDEGVLTQMYENCDAEETFIAHWMNLMMIVGSISVERFDMIKDSIKKRKIQNYSGEDVEAIATDYSSEWKRLHGARMYDHGLTLNMLKTIMESGNEDFRYGLRSLKEKLNKKLLDIRHLSYDEAHKKMVEEELDVQSVLKRCKQEYRILLDDGKWPAASHARDSKAIGRSYGSVNKAAVDHLNQLLANALQRNPGAAVGGRDKSRDQCRNCGEKGHWANECPKRSQGNRNGGGRRQMGQGRPFTPRNAGNNGNQSQTPRPRRHRFPPPRNGESEIKTGEGGKKYYWCSKCDNWTVSHGTTNHKTTEELRALRAQLAIAQRPDSRLNFDLQPAAFAVRHTWYESDSSEEESSPTVPTQDTTQDSNPVSMSVSQNAANPNNMILFDSGANCCISNDRGDFTGDYTEIKAGLSVEGMGKALKAEGTGTVSWTFLTDDNTYRALELPAFYIPSAQQKIASTGQILEAYPNENFNISPTELCLKGETTETSITVPICKNTSLPLAQAYLTTNEGVQSAKNRTVPDPLAKIKGMPSVTEGANFNLSEPEKELLRWHYRFGHVAVRRIQWMFRQGYLGNTERTRRLQSAASKLESGPMCTACQYAKQRRKTSPGSTKRMDLSLQGQLKADRLFPGQQVSVDHFHSKPHGRLLNTYGKESTDRKYTGGCVFVDHSSGYVHVELQSHLNTHETLKAKTSFESMCSTYGVVIQEYLSDNGTAFRNSDFESHLRQFQQTIRHSGVGAHHSNGIAERSIGTVMSITRAMLHHAAIHWPEVADVGLWPLAALHAVYVLNRLPKEDTGQSAYELFTRTTWPRGKFHDFHVWGSPAYVLDDSLADGRKLPRWRPRSGRHVYVGNGATLTAHSHATPLILNLDTGKITAQYHVIHDDHFSTVHTSNDEQPNFDHDDWYKTFGLTESQYIQDEDETSTPPQYQRELALQRDESHRVREQQLPPVPIQDNEMTHAPEPITLTTPLPRVPSPIPLSISAPVPSMSGESSSPIVSLPQKEKDTMVTSRPQTTLKRAAVEPRRSERIKERLAHYIRTDFHTKEEFEAVIDSYMVTTAICRANIVLEQEASNLSSPLIEPLMDFWSRTVNVNAAKAPNKPDTYMYHEIFHMQDRANWLESMQVEIDALEAHGCWKEDLRSNAKKVVPCKWVLTYKRNPDGTIKKRKGRVVLRGDLQEYEGETFSPVAAWSTIRAFLAVSTVKNQITTTIDFENAFIQSPLPKDEPVWMEVPKGYTTQGGPDYCLKLVKSLYGHASSPRLFYEFISKHFKNVGLKQSEHDPCLWTGRDIMLVQYVDDCGISAPNQEVLDKFIKDLRHEGLVLTQESTFAEFLGIKFEVIDGKHVMTQKGLIKKVLEATQMTDCNPNSVPATLTPLGKDVDGKSMTEDWNLRSIIGMLLYLSGNTRSDIAFAVCQAARFVSNPKQSHATGVKTILRYLKGTQDKGTTVEISDSSDLIHWVDAEFGGLFKIEPDRDPDSVRCREGWIIKFANWPLVVKSQLQTHLSQSTLEAEYCALSDSLKVLLPLQRLLKEILNALGENESKQTVINATVFEDNQSAYYLATNQRVTNRTRYLLSRWHWFWDAYNRKEFEVKRCSSEDMQADFLTKPLPRDKFIKNRKAVMGW